MVGLAPLDPPYTSGTRYARPYTRFHNTTSNMRPWAIILSIAFCGPAAAAAEPDRSTISPRTAVTLQTALQWTLTRNPDLVAQRQNLNVSAAAVRVAERFPTSLNPTVAVTVQPWVFQRGAGGDIDRLEPFFTLTWQQPIEIGHRTCYREAIARAGYTQTQWNLVQAELLALVETYRVPDGHLPAGEMAQRSAAVPLPLGVGGNPAPPAGGQPGGAGRRDPRRGREPSHRPRGRGRAAGV